MSRQRSLEQERASRAWECVAHVRDSGAAYATKYASLARGAPADIQLNGLGQTLAFWRAKGYEKGKPKSGGANEHYRLLEDVSIWLREQLRLSQTRDLVEWVCNAAATSDYHRATAEAIAFLGWVKRFAEAELGAD